MTDIISKEEAKEFGLQDYFTGIPCKHGHISKRSVAWGKCVECNNGHSKAQYESDPEKCKQATRDAYIKTNGAAQKKYSEKIKLNKLNKTTGE